MENKLRISAFAVVVIFCALAVGTPAHAANWLMLQGTERPAASPRIKVWGFIQAQYQSDNSSANDKGGFIPPKLIGPNLTTQKAFNINRARLGGRGTGMPLDSKVNYFLLVEFGNNGITGGQNGFAKVTDASVTFNHIPGARVRVGLFKTPGPEEGLQAIHVFDYINFTTMSNQMMLERFPNKTYTPNNSGPTSVFDGPVGAFRDVGIQVFESFKVKGWDLSYAFMIGNGNGLAFGEVDENQDTYLYLSAEKMMGGKGPRAAGLKMFAWTQSGTRSLDDTNDDVHNPKEYDRKRSGVGVKYLKKPYRVTAEYMVGDGMIFVGPNKPTFQQAATANAKVNASTSGAESEASGYYAEFGWYIPNSNFEIDVRYDYYERLTASDNKHPKNKRSWKSEWTTWTLGMQYHFNKKARLTVNYSMSGVESPDWPSNTGPNANMDGIDSRLSAQVTSIF